MSRRAGNRFASAIWPAIDIRLRVRLSAHTLFWKVSSNLDWMIAMDYLDFELEIGSGSGREYPVRVLRSPDGEAQATMRFPFDTLQLDNHLKDLELALLRSARPSAARKVLTSGEQSVQEFGRALFDALFSGEILARYVGSRRGADAQHKGLRIKLRIRAPELAALPWEFLYDPSHADYVCLSRWTPLVRYPEAPQPIKPFPVTTPLRILGMVANPTDQDRLDTKREQQRVAKAVEHLESLGLLTLEWCPGQTWRDLQKVMWQGEWHIFHFVGHGAFDRNLDEGIIALTDAGGRTARLRATHLARLLRDHRSLRLVVVNACEGARGSSLDVFSSTAATLLQHGIPAVLAMQYEISDLAAIEFARGFYEAVTYGMPIDDAVAVARTAVSIEIDRTVEWGTPVLYMRSPDGRIFDVTTPASIPLVPEVVEIVEGSKRDHAEQERRLVSLYAEVRSAFDAKQWTKAIKALRTIVSLQPDYRDAERLLVDATRQQRLGRRWATGRRAYEAGSWAEAIRPLEAIVAEDADYEDAARVLDDARRHQELAGLYAEARRLHQANQWQAVVEVFVRMQALDPEHPDPDGLWATAREYQYLEDKEFDTLYRRAHEHMENKEWAPAAQQFAELQRRRPGYRDVELRLGHVRQALADQQERQEQQRLTGLYEEARSAYDAER
jgi:hypothetical protein